LKRTHSSSLTKNCCITPLSILTGIAATSSRIRCFRAGVVLGGLPSNTFVLRCPHRKKPHTVKSGDLGGYAISPFREITRPGNKALTAFIEILAPSC
ncbi:hypothetical protein C0J52_25195, partial [Blattella germanica]